MPRTEKIVVGADLNEHMGTSRCFSRSACRKKLWPKEQRRGENIGKQSLDLALGNTFFNKKEGHLITYKNGGNSSQIDFLMTRRADLKEMRDCKVIPGEEVVSEHRLLCPKDTHKRREAPEKRGLRSGL